MALEILFAKLVALNKLAKELLQKRERGRQKFAEQVVEPLNTVFSQLASEHMATFAQLDSMLSEETVSYSRARSFLDRNILFESGTVHLLRELTDSYTFNDVSQSSLRDSFQNYISEIVSCLIIGAGDTLEPLGTSVSYYSSLRMLLWQHPGESYDQASLLNKIGLRAEWHLVKP